MKNSYSIQALLLGLALISVGSRLTAQTAFGGLNSAYHSQGLALGSSVFAGAEAARVNPAALVYGKDRVITGFVRYPADIKAGLAEYRRLRDRINLAFGIRHLNYGSFEGYDDNANRTGDYRVADTWVTMSVGGTLGSGNLHYGLTSGLHSSSLGNFNASALVFTPGLLVDIPAYRIKLGLTVRNLGIVLDNYTDYQERLPTLAVVAVSRQLAYLPLEIALDVGYYEDQTEPWAAISGIFTLVPGLELRWGTSTDKINQGSGNQELRDFLAASGLNLSLTNARFTVDAGGYFYGPGAWSLGGGLGVAL